jgi:hypothetical protein
MKEIWRNVNGENKRGVMAKMGNSRNGNVSINNQQ